MKAIGRQKFNIIQEKSLVLDGQRETLKTRLAEIDEEMAKEKQKVVDPAAVCQNLQYFEAVFALLTFEKQRDLVHLLIKRIAYHKDLSKLAVSLYNLPPLKKPPENGKKSVSGGSSVSSRLDARMYWLPEDDPYQTFLEDEFEFAIRLIVRGQKQLILQEPSNFCKEFASLG